MRPKHLIVDQGPEFKCEHFENVWCKARNILPRFGAVGKHGSIAVVERFHRTLKEILRLITVPEDQTEFEREVGLASSIGTTSIVLTTRSAARRRTRYSFRAHQPTSSRASSLAHAGHVDRRAPNRKSASTVILAIRSSWSWIAFRGAAIFLLFVLAALRDHDPCHETLR